MRIYSLSAKDLQAGSGDRDYHNYWTPYVNNFPQSVVDGLESTVLFNLLKENLASTPEIVSKVRAIFSWNITKAGKTVAKWSEWAGMRV